MSINELILANKQTCDAFNRVTSYCILGVRIHTVFLSSFVMMFINQNSGRIYNPSSVRSQRSWLISNHQIQEFKFELFAVIFNQHHLHQSYSGTVLKAIHHCQVSYHLCWNKNRNFFYQFKKHSSFHWNVWSFKFLVWWRVRLAVGCLRCQKKFWLIILLKKMNDDSLSSLYYGEYQ